MTRRNWHLDIQFDDALFSRNWDSFSQKLLINLFRHIDSTTEPVLSMLPPGVSPAGAAAAASIYFLPGMSKPPQPHCRIAVFPGLHFVRQVRSVGFNPPDLYKATQKARAAGRGYGGVEGALDKLRQKSKEADPFLFHWVFRCQRSWTRYRQKESVELLPRAYFGRNDPYSPIVDFIESDHLEIFSNRFEPYDLLIYCPYFHSRAMAQTEEDLDAIVSKISKFSAYRKLIVARSPFDYWSRRLESKFKTKGIALSAEDTKKSGEHYESGIQFTIVNQFINISSAKILFDGIKRASKETEASRQAVNEIKFLFRRLLVSLNPRPREGEESISELLERLESLGTTVGLNNDEPVWKIIMEIKNQAGSYDGPTKLEKLKEMIADRSVETWVTKDLDREILADFKQAEKLDVTIRLADRWMAPGSRDPRRPVILSRIDREGDLDLVAYLKSGDSIVMSAWEAVVRGASIMAAWERSDRWRGQAIKSSIVDSSDGDQYADPVLALADYLDSTKVNHQAVLSPHAPEPEPAVEEDNWWDDHDTGSILDTDMNRAQLLESTGATTFLCRELRLDGGFGMFVLHNSEIQVIEDESDGDILTIPVADLEPEMTAILFKDAERNSIFDILMDQLERSPEHQNDARVVRNWKDQLREHVVKKDLKISMVAENLEKSGRAFEPITIRSWIYGPTMAPMKQEHLNMLISAVKLEGIDATGLFKSVKNLRNVARTLGRALNEVIIKKNLDQLDEGVRSALFGAGIDLDELSGAIETRRLIDMLPNMVEVEAKNIRKLFKVAESDE